jgi:hypothetical protein
MKTASFNPNLVPPVTGLILAVSCDWDKVRILSIAIEALIDANGHAEAFATKRTLGANQEGRMSQEFQPNPAQQNLLNFLDKLATSPYSPELIAEGNQLLDAAVEENQRLSDSIHQTSNAMRNAKNCAELEGQE